MEKVKARFRNRWFVVSVILLAGSCVLTGFNVYQGFNNDNHRSFNFSWSPVEQLIANGTLWVNVTTWWDSENFYATVRVNDYDPEGIRELGIAFDRTHDWKITEEDEGYILSSFNGADLGWIIKEGLVQAVYKALIYPSPWHECFFNNETGFEFHIKFPKTKIEVDHPTLIHISYRRDPWIHWNGTDIFLGDTVDYLMSFVSFEVIA